MRMFLLILALALAWTPVHAVMLCAKPKADGSYNTSVKLRTACKPSETQLDPGALGLQGPPGPKGDPGEPGVCPCPESTTTTTTSTTSTTLVTSGCFRDSGDGTVFDTCTGLQWEKKEGTIREVGAGGSGGGGTNVADPHDVSNVYGWAGCCGDCTVVRGQPCQPNAAAEAACKAQTPEVWWADGCNQCETGTCSRPVGMLNATTVWDWLTQLNAANFAGHNDWRLPTMAGCCGFPTGEPAELESIVSLGVGPPTIDPIFGPTATANRSYWSASTFSQNPVIAWSMNFSTGAANNPDKGGVYWVRAVR